jgi:TonB family protein
MILLVDLSLRAALIVLVGLTARAALRHRSAALRHAVLAASLFAAAAAAPLSLALPGWDVPWLAVPRLTAAGTAANPSASVATAAIARDTSDAATQHAATPIPSSQPAATSASPMTWVPMVWAAGVLVCLGLLGSGLGRLLWIDRRARRLADGPIVSALDDLAPALGVRRQVALLQTDTDEVLATWGLRRPRILLPRHAADWSADRLRVVLTHELAHIARADWSVQLAADLVCAVFWFNPLMWIASDRLRRDSEQACDDRVLGAGVTGDRYATHLLAIARRARRPHQLASAVPMARSSTLERRIAAMLNPAVNRRALTTRALMICAGLVAIVAVPIAGLRAAQTTPLPLTGVVYDPTGAVMPQVALTIEDEQQNKIQAGSTDGGGRFVMEAIAPGSYILVAELPGFRPLRQTMELRRAADWQRAITLQVGTLKETVSIQARRPTASRPSAGTGAAPSPVRVGGNIKAPMKLANVNPEYPPTMREAGLEGQVPLEAIISRDGSVQSLRVLSAQVHPDFVKAAVDAVQQWRYSPTLLNGAPVEVVMNVTLNFSLENQ